MRKHERREARRSLEKQNGGQTWERAALGTGPEEQTWKEAAPARPAGPSEAPQPRAWTAGSLGGSSGVFS